MTASCLLQTTKMLSLGILCGTLALRVHTVAVGCRWNLFLRWFNRTPGLDHVRFLVRQYRPPYNICRALCSAQVMNGLDVLRATVVPHRGPRIHIQELCGADGDRPVCTS